jgi:CIC family chloride channel protein
MVFIFPSLWGEGYESINKIFIGQGSDLLNNSLFFDWKSDPYVLLIILVLILIFKVFAMAITTSSGGVGGIFAPTLFMGAIGGYILSLSMNTFFGLNLPHANFALAGMGALMAGVMHAPLLGIFLIAEITGGYQLLVPLIISATVAYVVATRFEPHSIYTKRLGVWAHRFLPPHGAILLAGGRREHFHHLRGGAAQPDRATQSASSGIWADALVAGAVRRVVLALRQS